MGYGDLEPLIRKHVQKCDNIYVHAAVATEMGLQYTASADIGVSYIDNPSLNDRFCLPNKLFEYIMARLPVIVNDAPEMRRVVNEHQIGHVIRRDLTVEAWTKALEKISQVNPQIMRRNLNKAAELYCWENQEKIMVNAYRQYVTTEN
jgi:glycosyltransferase involved in cell wall biosynthesis